MSMVTCDIAPSVDGYVAGPNQTLENPFGEGVEERLHRWMFDGAEDNAEEIAAVTSAGAYIMGRNMFGPGRGVERGMAGLVGPRAPYRAPVFVLTHHPREMFVMEGGTTFTFVTDGAESALAQARAAAGDRNVSVVGGTATINQYLAAGLTN